MSNAQGTIETIAQELTKLLQPLKDDLAPARARTLFAELGFAISPPQVSSLSVPLKATGDSTLALIQKSKELGIAIEANNIGDIIKKGLEIINTVKTVIDSFAGIRNGINGLGLPGVTAPMISSIPEKLFNHLLLLYLERLQGVTPVLSFLGVLNQVEQNIGSIDPTKPPFTLSTFHFDKFGNWLSKPSDQLKSMYQWGDNAFDGKLLFSKLEDILSRQAIPVIYDETALVPKIDLIIVEGVPKTDINPKGVVFKIKNELNTNFTITEKDFDLNFKVDFNPPTNTELLVQPNGNIAFTPPTATPLTGKALFDLKVKKKTNPAPYIILGQTGGSRFEVVEFGVKSGSNLTWQSNKAVGDFFIEGSANGCKIVIDASSGDGFLQNILPLSKIESMFDITFGASSQTGIYFRGSSALEIRLPVHIQIGPIAIEGLTLALKLKDGKFPIELGADIKAELGPLVAVVQNMGVKATFSFPPNNSGNLGPVQLDIGFKPPTGVGLSLDAGGFKGGGFLFFDPDKGEYGGALELDFNKMFSVKAIGLINTKMPDGTDGFSLLIIIAAEFTPIQLGFGFTLNGVGGIFGLNRTMRVSALQEGIKTNAIKSILFPENVVANINRIISDIKQFFPPKADHFIIGPMAKLGWGTPSILTVELGLLLDLPEPIIVIVGVIKAGLPTPDVAILRLQVNFIGVLDFKEGYIFFRADLYDSYLLAFNLTGSLAFLVSWGTQKTFAISIGGFHPDFRDIPSIPALPNGFRNMDRLGISLLSGDNPRLRVECYFAVTTNTVQFGAKVELYAEAAGFNVYGYLGFDVLFQFDPFMFIIKFYAGLALRSGTSTIASIDVRGTLSGPTPWDVNGEASLTILFFEISVGFHVTWGDPPSAISSETEELRLLLERDFADIRNWRAELPPNNHLHVSIKELPKVANQIVVHPAGILTFSQRTLPLKFDIQKFGNKAPKTDKRFEFKNAQIVHPSGNIALDSSTDYNNVVESFAANQFEILSDDQKLSRKSFEDRKSGFILRGTAAIRTGKPVAKDVDYELIYLKKAENKLIFKSIIKLGMMAYNRLLGGNAVRKSVLSKQNNRVSFNAPPEVILTKPKYAVANVSDMKLHSLDLLHDSEADAYQAYNKLIKEKPELAGEIQIVNHFELQH